MKRLGLYFISLYTSIIILQCCLFLFCYCTCPPFSGVQRKNGAILFLAPSLSIPPNWLLYNLFCISFGNIDLLSSFLLFSLPVIFQFLVCRRLFKDNPACALVIRGDTRAISVILSDYVVTQVAELKTNFNKDRNESPFWRHCDSDQSSPDELNMFMKNDFFLAEHK